MTKQPPVFSGPSGRKPYTVTDKPLGGRFDGGKSPLNLNNDIGEFDPRVFDRSGDYVRGGDPIGQQLDSVLLSVNPPEGLVPPTTKEGDGVHPHLDLVSDYVVRDLERIVRNRGERLESESVRSVIRSKGYDPDHMSVLPVKIIRGIHNALIAMFKSKMLERKVGPVDVDKGYDSLYTALLVGEDSDPVDWGVRDRNPVRTTLGDVRKCLGMSVADFLGLGYAEKVKVIDRASRRIVKRGLGDLIREDKKLGFDEAAVQARIDLHESLRAWSAGSLVMEKPQGSSLHHLLQYNQEHTPGKFARGLQRGDGANVQVVIVENEWIVPDVEGQWRVPFPLMCWEFRIDGVRVLVFTDHEDGRTLMYCVYGRDGHWTIDDYSYEVGLSPKLGRGVPCDAPEGEQLYEFRRVAERVHDVIRATCIMLEAEVSERVEVSAPRKIVERRINEGRTPPRDHYVVRLLGRTHRAHVARGASGSRSADARAPQRGHWRKGTWVHYDDVESGAEKYVDDGGFWHSRTWRKWHFAGDPNNIIHKEYRV